MSNREICIAMLDRLSEERLVGIIAAIQNAIDEQEEAEDDAFCEKLYQDYLNDPDPEKDTLYTLEECKKEWGLD